MKKILLALAFALVATFGKAQSSPDFTVTDMDGHQHNLYTYLNQGKVVVLDFWATWCGPCLASIPGLEKIYDDRGPEGDQTYVVLSIELDPSTNNEAETIIAHGIKNPVVKNTTLHNNYNYTGSIPYFVVISPDKSWQDRVGGIGSNDALITSLANNSAQASTIDNDGKVVSVNAGGWICSGQSSVEPKVEIRNIANNPLTSLTLTTKVDGVAKNTYNWSGNLTKFTSANVTLPEVTGISFADHLVEVVASNPNNGTDENPLNNSREGDITAINTQAPSAEFELRITPDDWGSEITWNVTDVAGTVIQSGGPYSDGNHTPIVKNFTLPKTGCFVFNIYDSYGDGLTVGGGSYSLKSGSTTLISGSDYGSGESLGFNTTSATGIDADVDVIYGFYPNPVANTGTLTLNMPVCQDVTITLNDIMGHNIKVIHDGLLPSGDVSFNVDFNTLPNGIYFARISTAQTEMVQRVVLSR